MFEQAKPARDAFTFSLGGMAAINSYALPPIVANDGINQALDRRLAERKSNRETRRPLVLKVEDALARYFAPSSCTQT